MTNTVRVNIRGAASIRKFWFPQQYISLIDALMNMGIEPDRQENNQASDITLMDRVREMYGT